MRRALGTLGSSSRGSLASVKDVQGLTALIGLVSAMYFVRGAEMVLYVVVVRDLLDAEPSTFGYLAGAVGFGAVLATPLARRGADASRPGRALGAAVVITVLPTAALAFSGQLLTAALLLVLVGAGMVVFEVVSVVVIQRTSPRDELGRVFGAVNSASNAAKLLGAILAPALVALFGADGALVAVAVVLAAATIVALPSVRRLGVAADDRRRRLHPVVDVLADLELLDGAPLASVERVADALVEEDVPAGTVLIREGDPADDLFVAVAGRFEVTANDITINHMGAGDWFGEIGLVDRVPRTATVTTVTAATVWRIPGDVFLAALEDSGAPPISLVEGIADRLATGRAT